jgi:hypothetical protein
MAKIGQILINWNNNGEIELGLSVQYEKSEEIFCIGAIALVDHLLSTLCYRNILYFCETVLQGVVTNEITTKPINSELRSVKLELHLDPNKNMFTILEPKTKWFCDNQKVESAVSQMGVNYIGKLLATVSNENKDPLKYGVLGLMSTIEEQIRIMDNTHKSVSTARMNVARLVGMAINGYPYNFTADELNNFIDDVENLLRRWNNLPLKEDQCLFYK